MQVSVNKSFDIIQIVHSMHLMSHLVFFFCKKFELNLPYATGEVLG